MRLSSFFTLVYSIIVFLSGIMSYQYAAHSLGLYLETTLAVVLFIDVFFMIKKKKFADYLALVISAFLLFFYGYMFSISTDFFAGVLTGISIFMVIILLVKIFRLSGSTE